MSAFRESDYSFHSDAKNSSGSSLSYIATPIDLTAIGNPHLVVVLKNLSKKDETTRSRALDELSRMVTDDPSLIDDALLQVWVQLYPRLSIDLSRQIQTLAHTTLGLIFAPSGKKIARHLGKVAGAWTVGMSCDHRGVSTAARRAFIQVFPNTGKHSTFFKTFHSNILEFIWNVIDRESPSTLSNEKDVAADEAELKYSRLLTSAIATLNQQQLLSVDLGERQQDGEVTYETIFSSSKFWNLAIYQAPVVRRVFHTLTANLVTSKKDDLTPHTKLISRAYIPSLNANQKESLIEFLQALIGLAKNLPSVWTTSYKSKTPVIERLVRLLSQGTQTEGPVFWSQMTDLIEALTPGVMTFQLCDLESLCNGAWKGMFTKGEFRPSIESGLEFYRRCILHISETLSPSDELSNDTGLLGMKVINEYITPVSAGAQRVTQYFFSSLSKFLSIPQVKGKFTSGWTDMTDAVVQSVLSLERGLSEDTDLDRSWPREKANRWAKLYALTHSNTADGLSDFPLWDDDVRKVIGACIRVLKNTKGAETEAAFALLAVIDLCFPVLGKDHKAWFEVLQFLSDDPLSVYASPSGGSLADVLYTLQPADDFGETWNFIVNNLLSDAKDGTEPLAKMLSSKRFSQRTPFVHGHSGLQKLVVQTIRSRALDGTYSNPVFDLVSTLPGILSPHSQAETFNFISSELDSSASASSALACLLSISGADLDAVCQYLISLEGSGLLSSLLYLCDDEDHEIAELSLQMIGRLTTYLTESDDFDSLREQVFEIPMRLLSQAHARSPTPTRIALFVLSFLSGKLKTDASWKLALPDVSEWRSSLEPFVHKPVPPVLSVTEELKPVFLIQRTSDTSFADEEVKRDGHGLSPPLRFALYLVTLMGEGLSDECVKAVNSNVSYLQCLVLTTVLARINLHVSNLNELWLSPSYNHSIELFIKSSEDIVRKCLEMSMSESESFSLPFLAEVSTPTPWSYYNALGQIQCTRGCPQAAKLDGTLVEGCLRGKPDFRSIALMVACPQVSESTLAARTINSLVANLMMSQKYSDSEMASLEMFTAALHANPALGKAVSGPRMVMLGMKLGGMVSDQDLPPGLVAALFGAMTVLVPVNQAIHGTVWEDSLESAIRVWKDTSSAERFEKLNDTSLAVVYSSLEYVSTLIAASKEDPDDVNSDLVEGIEAQAEAILASLVTILSATTNIDERTNLAVYKIHTLANQIMEGLSIQTKYTGETDDLIRILTSKSSQSQIAAFRLLHRIIPQQQQQKSIDIVLNDTTGQLPELLESAVDSNRLNMADILNEQAGEISPSFHGYLLCWKVLFDHFEKASYRLQEDYSRSLKGTTVTAQLLDILSDVLDLMDEKPYQLSSSGINPRTFPSGKGIDTWKLEHARPLAVHIFFLCLKRLPLQARSWWSNLGRRGTDASRVKGWCKRYVSPLITADTLYDIVQWSSSGQASSSGPSNPSSSSTAATAVDDQAFSVKVNPKGNEVTAFYAVEDETMSVIVKLPGAYPLESATVESGVRVGVTEKRWQSWLLICQGLVTFSSGGIVDALVAWRKNVVGALRGHSECTICYSVISAQRELPTKKCATCRHLFHVTCISKWFKSSPGSTCPFCRSHFYTPYVKPTPPEAGPDEN